MNKLLVLVCALMALLPAGARNLLKESDRTGLVGGYEPTDYWGVYAKEALNGRRFAEE